MFSEVNDIRIKKIEEEAPYICKECIENQLYQLPENLNINTDEFETKATSPLTSPRIVIVTENDSCHFSGLCVGTFAFTDFRGYFMFFLGGFCSGDSVTRYIVSAFPSSVKKY
jgi:hypothetical protein